MPEDKKFKVEIHVKNLSPGMVFPYNAVDEEDNPIIPRQTTLSREKIHELKNKDIHKLYYVRDFHSILNPGPNSPIIKETAEKAVSVLTDIRKAMLHNTAANVAGHLNELAGMLFKDLSDYNKGSLSLFDSETPEEYYITHAVNVSILSMMTSILMKQEEFRIRKIGIGGLLFDIGKFLLPQEIIEKKGELNEEEWKIVKQHPILSYNYLKNEKNIDAYILNAVLFHHEWYSGGGYPFGVTYEKSNELAQMITLCDVFDAGTSLRPYHPPRHSSEIFSFILKYAGIRFNPRQDRSFLFYISKRLGEVPVFPIDSYVVLDSGEIGVVTGHSHDPYTLRPVVSVFINTHKQEKVLKYEVPVDLEQDYDRKVVERIIEPQFVNNLDKIRDRYKNSGETIMP